MPVNGDRLRERREACDLTQKDVAKALGIRNYQQYAQYERNEHPMNIRHLEKFAKLTNSSVDYLVNLSDNPSLEIDESHLSADEQLLLTLKREGHVTEAAIFVLSGRLPHQLDKPSRPLIESGDKSDIAGTEPAA